MKQQTLFSEPHPKQKVPADFTRAHCEAGGKICPYYRPQEFPEFITGEYVPNRGLCHHPAIPAATNYEWEATDKTGMQYYETITLKSGKTRRRKLEMEQRPDYIPNLRGCPHERA